MSDPSERPDLKPQWFQILLALADKDLHGYGIRAEVLQRTEGRMKLWPGMLYGTLKRMLEDGLIEEVSTPKEFSDDARERRFYRVTEEGREALATAIDRMTRYLEAARDKKIVPGHV